jgi:hypothetical protein
VTDQAGSFSEPGVWSRAVPPRWNAGVVGGQRGELHHRHHARSERRVHGPNLEEFQQGTHPRGFFTRYLAEGALNTFFDVRLALLNIGVAEGRVLMRILQPGGATLSRFELLPALWRRTLTRQDLAGLVSPDFSTVLESDQPVVLDRTMTWDASGYGSHAESSVAAPATTWYLAEGSTSGDFALFYLLQNPNATGTTATIRYLRPGGQPPIERQYSLAANSRTTIPVDAEGPELASTDVSGVVTATLPIIVERAMYMTKPGQIPAGSGVRPLDNVAVSSAIASTNGVPIIVERAMWWPSPALGPAFWTEAHNSPGATATAARWALAEGEVGGAQGAETFILIANTSTGAGSARVRLLFEDGTSAERTLALPALSRTNVNCSSVFPEALGTPLP